MNATERDGRPDEVHLSALETVLVIGTIGCLLLATWELGKLLTTQWLAGWVKANPFVHRRVILYGLAFVASVSTTLVASRFSFEFGRFGRTVSRAFLWYGTLLLLTTISIFVFDCLPEVVAGVFGAAVFVAAIYLVQRRYFTPSRREDERTRRGACFACGEALPPAALFCPMCRAAVGKRCSTCQSVLKRSYSYCPQCSSEV